MEITIYTDGGCSGNPGKGGWAFVLLNNNDEIKNSGNDSYTTNNKMELTAVIRSLEYVIKSKNQSSKINLYTDSQYVKNGITNWINNWKRNGWMTAAKKPVKNKELWIELDDLKNSLNIEFKWVKGHAGNKYNEMCDSMVQVELNK